MHRWKHGNRVGAEASDDSASADPEHFHCPSDGVGHPYELCGDIDPVATGGSEHCFHGSLALGVEGEVRAEDAGAFALFGAVVDGDDGVGAEESADLDGV